MPYLVAPALATGSEIGFLCWTVDMKEEYVDRDLTVGNLPPKAKRITFFYLVFFFKNKFNK